MNMTFKKSFVIILLLVLGISVFNPSSINVSAQAVVESGPLATMQISTNLITWQPLVANAGFFLTVATPSGEVLEKSFAADSWPTLSITDLNNLPGAEGVYTYQLTLIPALNANTQAALASVADDPQARQQLSEDLTTQGVLPAVTFQSGNFSVLNGQFVIPVEETTGEVTPLSSSGTEATEDQVVADDQIVQGSLCVGFDCVNGENFGFDTFVLKENNLRIYFNDTSTSSGFPYTDWRLTANDSASGGASYFAIGDATNSTTPFKIEANAPTNALYVEDYGRVGFGTNTPVLELHIKDSDTPSVRLEQDSSGGWTAQTWDVAGNESNFFIRDATNGSKLPFRIQPNTPSDSMTLKSNGYIGMGTWSPEYKLEVQTTNNDSQIVAQRTDGASAILSANANTVQIGSLSNHQVEMVVHDTVVMTVTNQGNMTLQGALSEYSDVNVKENFAAVDGMDVLNRINDLPISTWNYISDDTETRHMGPMAQDFYAAFGLGADDRHIASLDVNGVSLAAIQSLAQVSNAQKEQIDLLSTENTALKQDVESLEHSNSSLLKEVEMLENRIDALEQGGDQVGGSPSYVMLLWGLGFAVVMMAIVQIGLIRHLSKDKRTI